MSVLELGILLALVWLVLSAASKYERRHEHILVEYVDEHEQHIDENKR